jgi:hypothetical protein
VPQISIILLQEMSKKEEGGMRNRFLTRVSAEELREKLSRAERQAEALTEDQKYELLDLANNSTMPCIYEDDVEYAQYHALLHKGLLSTATEDEQYLTKIYFAALALQLISPDIRVDLAMVIFRREKDEVYLGGMGINDLDVIFICHVLAVTAITKLDLEENVITCRGAKVLAANQSLVSLNLSRNHIREEGLRALAANQFLTHLDIRGMGFPTWIARALAANQTLLSLSVSGELLCAESNAMLLDFNPITRHNHGKSAQTKTNFPSLLSIAGFYAKKYHAVKLPGGETLEEAAENLLPDEVKEQLDQRKVKGCEVSHIELPIEPVKRRWCHVL